MRRRIYDAKYPNLRSDTVRLHYNKAQFASKVMHNPNFDQLTCADYQQMKTQVQDMERNENTLQHNRKIIILEIEAIVFSVWDRSTA